MHSIFAPTKSAKGQHSAGKTMDVEGSNLYQNPLATSPPLMPWREFADWIRMGDSHVVVWGWIRNGYIPSQKYGKHMMVNVAQLTAQLMEKGEQL